MLGRSWYGAGVFLESNRNVSRILNSGFEGTDSADDGVCSIVKWTIHRVKSRTVKIEDWIEDHRSVKCLRDVTESQADTPRQIKGIFQLKTPLAPGQMP